MHWIYVAASYVLFALAAPVLFFRRKTRDGIWQRLGFYRGDPFATQVSGFGSPSYISRSSDDSPFPIPHSPFPDTGPRIWLHGASAGDVSSLAPLLRTLRAQMPTCSLFLSTFTRSGRMWAEARTAADARFADAVFFAPYDLLGATRRAVRAVRPDVLVLEYTELWPNLIWAAKRAGAKVVLHNGRFHPRKLRRYKLLFALIGNPLRALDLLLMRSGAEARRATELGAPPERIATTGNTKFDALLKPTPPEPELRRSLGIPPEGPVLVAGSTHEGEEKIALDLLAKLRAKFENLHLVIAPRYIERSPEVAALAQSHGLSAHVTVLDTVGQLARLYQVASVALIGGSFTARGGQNILEPAAMGKPVLFGPHMENFAESVALLSGRGGIQVAGESELYSQCDSLLSDDTARAALGKLAAEAVQEERGAAARNAEAIGRLWVRATGAITPTFLERLWYGEPRTDWATALRPCAWAFGGAVRARNRLFERRAFKVSKIEARVISVGNLVAGGAGKTPVVIALAERLIARGKRVAVIARGYGGRAPSGVVCDGRRILQSALACGDEPVLVARRVPGACVVVGKSRAAAAREAVEKLGAQVVILDDGFQHRALARDEDILVLGGRAPFGNGLLLPAGPLREPPSSVGRATTIWCCNGAEIPRSPIQKIVSRHRPTDLMDWMLRESLGLQMLRGKPVMVVAAIARPSPFAEHVAELGARIVAHAFFRDHHAFTADVLERLDRTAQRHGAALLVTTEKDAVRMEKFRPSRIPICALRIDAEIISGEETLEEILSQC